MSEFVVIIPLIVVILALLFYMGRLVVRAQRASMTARYEAWRALEHAPGPAPNDLHQQRPLNEAFFGGKADQIDLLPYPGRFPVAPYDQWITSSAALSRDAGLMIDLFLYYPDGTDRNSRDARRALSVQHWGSVSTWDRLNAVSRSGVRNPARRAIERSHIRIGNDWPHEAGWQASVSGGWRPGTFDGSRNQSHLNATRDAFFEDFDRQMETMARARPGEESTLAQAIRNFYLAGQPYRGPLVTR